MSEPADGVVINLNSYGATVRLDSGELVLASAADVEHHRAEYERAHAQRAEHAFELRSEGRRHVVVLAPQIRDSDLDDQIAAYLRSTQDWENDEEGRPAAERHFLHKKRRAAFFESKHH